MVPPASHDAQQTVITGSPVDPVDRFRNQSPPAWERRGDYQDIQMDVADGIAKLTWDFTAQDTVSFLAYGSQEGMRWDLGMAGPGAPAGAARRDLYAGRRRRPGAHAAGGAHAAPARRERRPAAPI